MTINPKVREVQKLRTTMRGGKDTHRTNADEFQKVADAWGISSPRLLEYRQAVYFQYDTWTLRHLDAMATAAKRDLLEAASGENVISMQAAAQPVTLTEKISEYAQLKAQLDELGKTVIQLRDDIVSDMDGQTVHTSAEYVATIQDRTRTTIDGVKFRRELPDIAEKYSKVSEYKELKVIRNKAAAVQDSAAM